MQGPKLQLTGCQCDQKLSIRDQNFNIGCQQATYLLPPRHLKFQGNKALRKVQLQSKQLKCSSDEPINKFTIANLNPGFFF